MNPFNIEPTLESLQSNLIRLQQDFDAHNHDDTTTKSFETVTAETINARTILIKKTSYTDSATGIWIGFYQGNFVLNLGSASTYFKWTGSALQIAGDISGSTLTGGLIQTATSGQRIRITSSAISSSAGSPAQSANSLMLINASGNDVLDFGSSGSILARILPTDNDVIGLLVQNSSALALTSNLGIFSILNASSSGVSLQVTQAGTGTSLAVSTSNTGMALSISSNMAGANYALYISHASASTAGLYISKNVGYAAMEIAMSANDSNATYGIAMAIANSGAGTPFAFLFTGSEKVNAAVGGSQDYKIRIRIGATTYFIPCYTA